MVIIKHECHSRDLNCFQAFSKLFIIYSLILSLFAGDACCIHDISFYQVTKMKNETRMGFRSIVAIHLTK